MTNIFAVRERFASQRHVDSLKGFRKVVLIPPGGGKTHLVHALRQQGVNAVDVDAGLPDVFVGYGEFLETHSKPFVLDMNVLMRNTFSTPKPIITLG